MKNIFKRQTNVAIDEQITKVLLEMNELGVQEPDYQKMLTYLERLNELSCEKQRKPVSWDTVATIAGHLGGILIIVVYENKHVISSKAIGMLPRLKSS